MLMASFLMGPDKLSFEKVVPGVKKFENHWHMAIDKLE